MGLLGSIGRAITGVPRALYHGAVKGDLKKAVGALGDTVRVAGTAAGFATGQPWLGAAAGGLGGAMQKADDEDASLGAIVKGGLGGAAMGYGAGQAGKALNIGKLIAGKGATVPGTASSMAGGAPAMTPASPPIMPAAGGAQSLTTGGTSLGQTINNTVGTIGNAGTKVASSAADMAAKEAMKNAGKRGAIGSVINFAKQNPELALGMAQTAAQTYAGAQEGGLEQRGLDLQERGLDLREEELKALEEERKRRFALDQMGGFSDFMMGFRPRY